MDLPIPRELTAEEQIIKSNFEGLMEAKIENCLSDAHDQERWARQLFRFCAKRLYGD